ncbi:restriction endonuclease subunit S [Clostridium estertheticum]|uniref:Type I restriction modification DNA specificity domain-containing protein n=1 Tax=Clostridium estertheticum subsp. estertheticum TaxID=1552 RepID=A0A1J0GC89_9CLOT|nr:restriction endonuclease subunit S [Clostridium estertheticum]APC38883.1 hypothetical protein A7L45_01765 [Clostridium estertheticum subsp. estertheticum]MBZ9615173.1 restriction endonuclease subunit S [Clostridium estertheticum subsp. laramiense]WAG75066.1 restriction endonuclease subunit S [Clostridium estertheticum]
MHNKLTESWKRVKLSEVGKILTGNTPSTKCIEYYNSNDVMFIKPNDLKENTFNKISYSKAYISLSGAEKVRRVPSGSVLVTCIGIIGKVALVENEACFNQQINAIIPDKCIIDGKFLGYAILRYNYLLKAAANAPLIPIINKSQFSNIEIMIPSVKVQKKIVKILEKAEEALGKRREANRLLDEYLKSVFVGMCSEESNDIKLVNHVVKSIDAGWSVGGEERAICNDEIAVLKISAVTKGTFDASKYKVISKDVKIKKHLSCKRGDILFSRANTRELVGASCIVYKDYDNLILPDKLWRITIDESLMTREFFLYSINTNKVRKEISKLSTGTSGSMLNISMAKFKNIELNVMSFKKQEIFSEIYLKIQTIKENTMLNEIKLSNLFNSLMKDAFNGKLKF